MKVFNLPDLGEGLPDAEIVEWLVAEGDEVKVDQPLVSMETAKAVVEVPSPYDGKVATLHGANGDVINTGDPLITIDTGEGSGEAAEPAEQDTQAANDGNAEEETDTPAVEPAPDDVGETGDERADTGTVVGNVTTSNEVVAQRTSDVGGVKVTPAVRALARKKKVNLADIEPTGEGGVVTADDVRRFADSGGSSGRRQPAPTSDAKTSEQPRTPPPAPERSRTPTPAPTGDWEPLRGTRRTMARTMSDAHARVVPTTLMDDADLHAWQPGQDITVRLLRALWAGARAEPGLNAWYDDEKNMRMVHKGMAVGMAVDTEDGLFVAALRDVHSADHQGLRAEINRLRDNVKNRSIPPEDLKDYTIMLSNFGVFAGRYATPIINPPCVAIMAAGKLRHEVVPVLGGFEVHRTMPLSLTFDHRACTGGEAARYLRAVLEDLGLPE